MILLFSIPLCEIPVCDYSKALTRNSEGLGSFQATDCHKLVSVLTYITKMNYTAGSLFLVEDSKLLYERKKQPWVPGMLSVGGLQQECS